MSDKSVLIQGDCLEVLKDLPDNSIDAIVTDPPYGLKFMGKKWDYGVPSIEIWKECLRVLKPGGHVLSFCGTRTYHRMVVNMEDAGFEIRDQVQWIYGSGFPKSHNIKEGDFKGWGTALKPANEPICLARKPLDGTVAANVEKWGVGGINIDACRIESYDHPWVHHAGSSASGSLNWNAGDKKESSKEYYIPQGRWPANVVFDEEAAAVLDEQSGIKTGTGKATIGGTPRKTTGHIATGSPDRSDALMNYGDSSGASRFFYVAKASKRERNEGCEGMTEKATHRYGAGLGEGLTPEKPSIDKNHHPTVKPIKLMEYLCKLITPPNGVILDPFMGSGSTGVAAVKLGFKFIGIEREQEYLEIAEKRINNATN